MHQTPNIIRNKIIARLVIIGMLFQAFTAVFHVSANASGQNSALSLFSRTIVICTGSGLVKITLNKRGEPVETRENTNGHYKCPVCFSFNGNAAALKSQADNLSIPYAATPLPYIDITSFSDNRPRFRHGRDPPEA